MMRRNLVFMRSPIKKEGGKYLLKIHVFPPDVEKTGATAGNLSVQLGKLKDAEYLTVTREMNGSYPLTRCAITPVGVAAFEKYVADLQRYLKPGD